MRIATWIPRGMREQLESIDPAANVDTIDMPTAAEIIAASGQHPPTAFIEPRSRRGRILAPLAIAVIVALIAAVGALIIRDAVGSHSDNAAARPDSVSNLALAPPPPAFPADANPRPVVVFGQTVLTSRFQTAGEATAFKDGSIDLATALPRTPATRDGYPVAPAAQAVRRIVNDHACCARTTTRLHIDVIKLIDFKFLTDRGGQTLPCWRIRFTGSPALVTVLAVAPSSRYPSVGANPYSGGTLGTSKHGRELTFAFIARHKTSAGCDPAYRSYLAVSQGPSAVRISIRIVGRPVACNIVGGKPALSNTPVFYYPGEPGTKTIRLNAPLGKRLVVDSKNQPYLVTKAKRR